MYRYAQSLIAFVAVGETGAFVKAAKQLGVTPSVISHHISKLEDTLGTTLIHRTTRKLTLSENGRQLFESAQQGLKGIDQAVDHIKSGADHIAGALKIALPAFVPDPALEARVMEFAQRYPHVALTLEYTDQVKDVVAEGYDLAVRIGKMPSSGLSRRTIGTVTHILVATPNFLVRHGAINSPADLRERSYISMGPMIETVTLQRNNVTDTVQLEQCQIRVQSILAAKAAAMASIGFANLPVNLVGHELSTGQLVQLLPDWKLPPLTIQAVWSGTSRRHSLTQRLLDFLTVGR
jgi:DNA-binding transcriptional LysR family regulator